MVVFFPYISSKIKTAIGYKKVDKGLKKVMVDALKEIKETTALDQQAGGDHYKNFKIQPIVYCQVNKLGHCEGNVVKYISRHTTKGGLEDLYKAIHMIKVLMEIDYEHMYTDGYLNVPSKVPEELKNPSFNMTQLNKIRRS
jgi:hypothetical protein